MVRIGQAAKQFGISVDTINYYVEYGLLVPPRKGGQRDFDERTLSDLQRILELKELEFSLSEIHRILSLYRISHMASRQDSEDLRRIYEEKKEWCFREKQRFGDIAARLDAMIQNLDSHNDPAAGEIGVPVSMLDLLCCPRCDGTLGIYGANMTHKYIYSGELRCHCGYCATIENGIVLTPNKNTDVYDTPDINRDTYKNLPPHLISLFQKSYNWMLRQLERMDIADKVVLETHVNAWFFMHNHQQYLDPRGRYIIVDKYPETLLMYKQLIDQQGFANNILYIADSSTQLPLQTGCVDLNIDFFAVNEHYFYFNTLLMGDLRSYFAKDARTLGTYFYFSNGIRSMQRLLREYPTCSPKNFSLQSFEQEMQENGLRFLQRETVGYTTSSGDNIGFSFHCEGERMYLMPYLAASK